MDFTIDTYRRLLIAIKKQDFSFCTFLEFLKVPGTKTLVNRHDVDKQPLNSLEFARIQADEGIRGTYYFRIVPESFDEKIIREIFSLGHEIGYHYEDVSLTVQRHKGVKAQWQSKRRTADDARHTEEELARVAIESFRENLAKLRQIVPVNTICMHGSPMSRWDSRLLWKYYDYHDFGIAGEPYFDIDFEKVLYLTDTGRRWDGDSFNVRDKVKGLKDLGTKGLRDEEKSLSPSVSQSLSHSVTSPAPFPKFHSTFDIIKAAEEDNLPDRIMMTFHPQRWTDKPLPWMKELVWQNVKNAVKFFLIRMRE